MYVHVRDYCTLVQGNDISFGVDCCLLLLKGSPEPQHGSNSIPRFFYAFKFHQILTKMKKFISALVLGCLLGFTFVSYALSAPSGVNARVNYRKILNDYCNNYLEADYGCMYVAKSLWVSRTTSISDTETQVQGTFGYYDYDGKRRNEKYLAILEVHGTEIQRISFKIRRKADMTHTQDYWVDGSSHLFGEKGRTADRQQQAKRYTRLLEEFCQTYYRSCFSGRSYVKGSLKVAKFSETEEGIVTVLGTHDYNGRSGRYTGAQFKAVIMETETGQRIKFYKESQPDLVHSSVYYEDCTKTLTY